MAARRMAMNMITFTEQELKDYTNNLSVALGNGAKSTVYKGFIPADNAHQLEQREVAVKVSQNALPLTFSQFENEIEWLPQFDHPNIIQMVGFCRTPERIYIVYELATRGNMLTNLEALDWPQTLQIIRGLSAAILYLHSRNLRIGNLKPRDILLDENFQPKLGDFKTITSMPIDDDKRRKIFVTPGYFDPATHYRGDPSLDDDIYCFGVIILQLLTKEELVVGRNDHIAMELEKATARGELIVHKELRFTGCSKRDAKGITGIAGRLTIHPSKDSQGEWFNIFRPSIGSIVPELNELQDVPGSLIQKGFLNLKLKAKKIKDKISKK